MRNKDKGFTRVDLVVTLLCTAFLAVTLGAVSSRGHRRGLQLVCASRLQKWGQAIFMHSADNGDMVMSMVRRWDPIPYPHYMAALPLSMYEDPPADYMRPGEFNLFALNPYLGAFSENFHYDGIATYMAACPATDSDFMIDWAYAHWEAFCGPDGNVFFIEPSYSYWNVGGPNPVEASSPGTSNGEGSENIMQDLTFDVLSPNRLLMSDVMNLDGGSPWFRYNHGARGWCWNVYWGDVSPLPGHMRADGQQDATGRNQLLGDGRVVWRPISLEFEDNIPSEITALGGVGYLENEWNGPGSGWVNPFDVSWY